MQSPLTAIRWTGRQGVWILLATSLGLRFALAALMPPGYDEVYYFFYGLHLDLSFFSSVNIIFSMTPQKANTDLV